MITATRIQTPLPVLIAVVRWYAMAAVSVVPRVVWKDVAGKIMIRPVCSAIGMIKEIAGKG